MYAAYQERPYNPDALYRKSGNYDTFDQMRADDQIAPLLSLKKYLILNQQYSFVCDDEEVLQWLNTWFQWAPQRSLQAYLYEIMSAFDYGFSFSEPLYALHDCGEYGKKVVLSDIKVRAPHSMRFEQDRQGNISKIIQDTATGEVELKGDKWIHYAPMSEFSNPYGKSDLTEGVYTAWWSKKIIIRFLNIYLERYGAPTVLAKYKSGTASSEERAQIKKVLSTLSAKSGIMFPDKFDIGLLGSGSGVNPYTETITMYNMMIARAMLVPDLAGYGGGETSGGSYALGEQQFSAWYMTLELPKLILVHNFNRRILKKLVAWNFGEQAAASAEMVLARADDQAKTESAKLWLDAVSRGAVDKTLDAVNTFLRTIDYPEIEELEEPEDEPVDVQDPAAMPDQEPETDVPDDEDEPEDDGEDKPEEPAAPEMDAVYHAMKRQPNKLEATRADFARMDRETETLYKDNAQAVGDAFGESINRLYSYIQRRRIIEDRRMDLVSALTFPLTKQLKNALAKTQKDAYAKGEEYAADMVPTAEFAVPQTMIDISEYIANWSEIELSAQSADILSRVQPILMEAIRTGQGYRETMRQVNDALKDWDYKLDSNGNLVSGARVETIVRTNTQRAYNQAAADLNKSLGDKIIAYQYSAIMDGRTSPLCEALDGKVFKPEELDKYNPPNHFNCRSTLIPIFKDIDEFNGYDKMPATTDVSGSFLKLGGA